MSDMDRAPVWMLKREKLSQRQWRQLKRRELKAVLKAFNVYRYGSAYCPGHYGEVGKISDLLDGLTKSHSQKEWGK